MTMIRVIELNLEQLNDLYQEFEFSAEEMRIFEDALNPKVQEKFVNSKYKANRIESAVAQDLLRWNKFYSPRKEVLGRVSKELNLPFEKVRKNVNFTNLKKYKLVDYGFKTSKSVSWIQLNKVGQVYFGLMYGRPEFETESWLFDKLNQYKYCLVPYAGVHEIGKKPTKKPGKKVRIKKTEIEKYMEYEDSILEVLEIGERLVNEENVNAEMVICQIRTLLKGV